MSRTDRVAFRQTCAQTKQQGAGALHKQAYETGHARQAGALQVHAQCIATRQKHALHRRTQDVWLLLPLVGALCTMRNCCCETLQRPNLLHTPDHRRVLHMYVFTPGAVVFCKSLCSSHVPEQNVHVSGCMDQHDTAYSSYIQLPPVLCLRSAVHRRTAAHVCSRRALHMRVVATAHPSLDTRTPRTATHTHTTSPNPLVSHTTVLPKPKPAASTAPKICLLCSGSKPPAFLYPSLAGGTNQSRTYPPTPTHTHN